MLTIFATSFRRQFLLFVIGVLFTFVADMFSGFRAPLSLMIALLLAHVLPTWFIAFTDFDRENEKVVQFIYTYAGPTGFGVFFGSLLGNIIITRPGETEQVGWSVFMISLLAFSVSMAYWFSGTMSRSSRYRLWLDSGPPEKIDRLVTAMKIVRYHNRADHLIRLVTVGNLCGILEGSWWDETVQLLAVEMIDERLSNEAKHALSNLLIRQQRASPRKK